MVIFSKSHFMYKKIIKEAANIAGKKNCSFTNQSQSVLISNVSSRSVITLLFFSELKKTCEIIRFWSLGAVSKWRINCNRYDLRLFTVV